MSETTNETLNKIVSMLDKLDSRLTDLESVVTAPDGEAQPSLPAQPPREDFPVHIKEQPPPIPAWYTDTRELALACRQAGWTPARLASRVPLLPVWGARRPYSEASIGNLIRSESPWLWHTKHGQYELAVSRLKCEALARCLLFLDPASNDTGFTVDGESEDEGNV